MASCCGPARVQAPTRIALKCPSCGSAGRTVNNITVNSLVVAHERQRVGVQDYNICLASSCDTVYYGPSGEIFSQEHLQTRVAFKDPDGPNTVCYCHRLTEGDIVSAMQTHPELLDFAEVSRFFNMSDCSCEHHHPFGGNCACSPAVGKAVKRGLADPIVQRNAAARRTLPVVSIYERTVGCCGKTPGLEMVDELRRRAINDAEAKCYDMTNAADEVPITPELLSLMMERGDEALPVVAIDGRVLWSGTFPSVDEVLTRLKHA
jgi:hypothetical protein